MSPLLPEGLYKFDCPIVYDNGFAELTHQNNGIKVQLLEDIKGSFIFTISSDNTVKIVDAEMDYPGLKRSFKGEGHILQTGYAEGNAIMWLKTSGPISRNHREGPWTLREATDREIKSYRAKQQRLEERKARAEKARTDSSSKKP